MPHADLKYSADVVLDAPALLAAIETTIRDFDDAAGQCKGRAYPCADFHRSHVMIEIQMLRKPHRDPDFMQALLAKLEGAAKAHIQSPCKFALALDFLPEVYVTNHFDGV